MMKKYFIIIYILFVLGVCVKTQAQNSILPILNDDSKKTASVIYEGEVVIDVDQTAYLVVSDNLYFELKSNVTLVDYNGRHVLVEGVELMHKLQPIEATTSAFNKIASVLIVLNIHELTE